MRRLLAATCIAAAVAASAALPGARPATAATPGNPLSDYCRPSATAFDPRDVPPGGSASPHVPGVRERYITVNGVRTRLLESGDRRNDTSVVFVHGSPGSAADYADLMPPIVRGGGRAIAFDGPGFGHAADTWGMPRTIGPTVDFMSRALRQLGVRRVHLVAHDVGAAAGLEWGARHPSQLRSVALIDGGMLFDYREHSLAQISRSRPGGEAFWLQLNRASFSAGAQNGQPPTNPLPQSYLNRLYDDLDRETRCAIIGLYRQTDASQVQALARSQARALSRQPRRPALVIWGKRDPYLPAKHAYQQRRGLPSARVEIFDTSGHFPFADSPERTRRLLVPFLRGALTEDGAGGGGAHGRHLAGTPGNDVLRGTPGDDVIDGGGGDDVIQGLGGDDTLIGGSGNDAVQGGDGDDRLTAGSGNDSLSGQRGDDSLDARDGVRGNDVAGAGPGADRCSADPRDSRSSC